MLFYKVEGMLINTGAENEDSRRAQRENARRIYMKSEDYNHKRSRDAYCFVSESSDRLLTAGIITDQAENVQRLAEVYLNYIGCTAVKKEATAGNYYPNMSTGRRNEKEMDR